MEHRRTFGPLPAALVVLTVPLWIAGGAEKGVPRAVFPETLHNWGTVFSGEEVLHRFPVFNEGTGTLAITKVIPSCQCTTKQFTSTVAPQGRGAITLTVDTTGILGTLTETATVFTNDPECPSCTLTLHGETRAFATLKPPSVRLAGIAGSRPQAVEVLVQPASEIRLESLQVLSSSDTVQVRISPLRKDGTFLLHVAPKARRNQDSFHEEVVLQARGGGRKVRLSLPVYGTLKRRVSVRSKWVLFRYIETERWERDPSKVPRRTVKLRSAPGVSFTVKELRTEGGFFSARLKEVTPGKAYDVVLSLTARPPNARPYARGRLVVLTDDPFEKEVKVAVIAFFKGKKKKK